MTRNQNPDQMIEEFARLLEADPDAAVTGDDELDELIHLAEGLRDVPTAVPTTEFRERLRGQLLTEAASMLPATSTAPDVATIGWRERLAHWRRSVSLAVASALSATTIGGAGVAVAAQQSLPGDALYGVKQGIESVRMAVASGDLETGRLHLAFARERLEEVTEGAGTLPPDRLVDTLQTMDDASALGANELMDRYDRTGETAVLQEVAGFVDHQRAGLYAVLDELPVETVPFAERSLELIRRIEVQATELFLHGCEGCEDGLPGIPRPGEAPAMDTSGDSDTDVTGDDPQGTDTDTGTTADTAEEPSDGESGLLDDPLGGLDPLDPATNEPTLDPSLEPSLPTVDPTSTDELDDTVDDVTGPLEDTVDELLYE